MQWKFGNMRIPGNLESNFRNLEFDLLQIRNASRGVDGGKASGTRRSKSGSSKEGPEKGLSRADLILAGLENKSAARYGVDDLSWRG